LLASLCSIARARERPDQLRLQPPPIGVKAIFQ